MDIRKKVLVYSSLAVVIFVLLLLAGVFIGIYTDYLWFKELGYQSIYLKIIFTKLALGAIFFLLFFLFVAGNVFLTRYYKPSLEVVFEDEVLGRIRSVVSKFLSWLAVGLALFVGVVAGVRAADGWKTVLLYFNRASFNLREPIFHRDISYYVFELPFYRYIYSYLLTLLLLTTLIVFLIYFVRGMIRLDFRFRSFKLYPFVWAHLSVLLGLIFILKGWDYYLRLFELLYSPRGAVFGASYTDVKVLLPVLKILIVTALIAAFLFLLNIYYRGLKLPLGGIALLSAVSLIGGVIYPSLVQQYKVQPDEVAKESKYIRYNIFYTRKAYSLDKIRERSFAVEDTLTLKDISKNQATIKNIRLWDWRPLLKTYSQLQEIRLYYTFSDVDVDRYKVGGEKRQVLLSAREMSVESLPEKARTWVNEHLVYTHGYGLCASPVNEVSGEGLPNFFVKDIPPKSSGGLKIKRPEIYYGEKTDNYVVVKTKNLEFDYPRGDTNKYTIYKGEGGIRLSNFLRRAAFSWRLSSLRLLLSDAITSQSRIMFRRNIGERVRTIAPFLDYDSDPYLVVAGGKLYWLCDAYTTSSMYPYSTPYAEEKNYIRNSVKVVIDAYNGTTTFYVMDKKEPIIRALRKAFPILFKNFSEMPKELKEHIRYPVDFFKIQASLYSAYHMKDPRVFYNREDAWDIAKETLNGSEVEVEPYYVIMGLPEDISSKNLKEKENFILILPFTPVAKSNMIAWLSASSDIPNYGSLLVYKFPKQKLVFGPAQVEARINQDSEISQLLTLWSQRGSQVIRGNLLVIPIENSVIYVEPLYLKAEQSELPELKRVIVVYGEKVVMKESLKEALDGVFGEGETEKEAKRTLQELVEAAIRHFEQAKNLQKEGDWAGYGDELNKLKETLDELSEYAKALRGR